jgi:hypothetical protein
VRKTIERSPHLSARRHSGSLGLSEASVRRILHKYLHNITAKAALKFGSEAWVLKKREEQRLEGGQSKFLRHLLRRTKLDKDKNERKKKKTGAQNTVKEIKQYQKKVATTRTDDGHK